MIKRILFFSFLILFIPYFIINIFIRKDYKTFNFSNNTMVRVYRSQKGLVERIPIEKYIIGVLSGEMPTSFSNEALKAQAVASRSYVMKQMERNFDLKYDVIDTIQNQVYLDIEYLKETWKEQYQDKINKIRNAVLSTKGEYLEYDGEIVEALFFSTSPGMTENSEEIFISEKQYLRSVVSTWDQISPAYTSKKEYTKKEFYNLLNLCYSTDLNVEIISKTSTGRIKKIKINEKIFDGNYISSKLNLKSTFFEIKSDDLKIIISVKGYGHGVGMSQYGAEGMAQEGYSYDKILKHYYTNVQIKKF